MAHNVSAWAAPPRGRWAERDAGVGALDNPPIGTDGGGQARGRAPQAVSKTAEERKRPMLCYVPFKKPGC